MNLLRILAIAAAAWIIYSLLRRNTKRPPAPRRNAGGEPEAMVKCAYCGTHVPASEAVWHGQRGYCSARHRDADTD